MTNPMTTTTVTREQAKSDAFVAAAYFTALGAEGVPPEQAVSLTAQYMWAVLAARKPNAPKEPWET